MVSESDCQADGRWFKSCLTSLLKHACVEGVLAAMLAIYTGKGVTTEVNLNEHISHTAPQSSNKAAHSGFETQRRRCHKKSKGMYYSDPTNGHVWNIILKRQK